MSIVWDILLLGSRVSLNESEQERLQELSRRDVDWQELFDLADFHRILALVYRQLRKHCSNFLPEQILESAQGRMRRQGMGNLMMVGVLVKVLAALEKRGIKAIPFKGPVFAEAVFGDLALRSYCDLDVLISENDLPRTVEAMRAEGFKPFFPLSNSQLKVLAKTDNEYPLRHPMNGIVIDLQWELIGGYSSHPLQLNTLMPNLRTFDFLGRSVSVFGKEDLLVYLCIHGNQHVWEQLDQVCCIAETIRTGQDLDWNMVWVRAEHLGVGRMVRIGLFLASFLLATELPAHVISVIQKDRQAVVLAKERSKRLAQPLPAKTNSLTSRRFSMYHWKCFDSPWQVIRYGCHIFFVPTRYDWERLPLPVWLSPLHYIYRPLRLILAGIKTIWARFH